MNFHFDHMLCSTDAFQLLYMEFFLVIILIIIVIIILFIIIIILT